MTRKQNTKCAACGTDTTHHIMVLCEEGGDCTFKSAERPPKVIPLCLKRHTHVHYCLGCTSKPNWNIKE